MNAMFCVYRLSRVYYSNFRTLATTSNLCYLKETTSTQTLSNLLIDKDYLKDKLNEFVIWYEQLTGMDEVRMMQNRVIEAQDRFITAQESRRDVNKELTRIQSKLKEIHSELDTTSRGEERYLQLITEEHAILKEERILSSEFASLEREERESFNLLSSCVKESHEKERAQADRTKYWSIIGSIVGTVIGVAGSSINNHFKMRELRNLVRESVSKNASSSTHLSQHERQLSQLVSNMKEIIEQQTKNKGKYGKVDADLSAKLERVVHSMQNVNHIGSIQTQVEEMKSMLQSAQRHKGQLVAIPQDMEAMIVQQQQQMNLMIITVTVMGLIVPIFITFLART